ncbi:MULTISPECIES: glycosyltransferase [unclassified Streptomyces]|uniref:glycosyltransferase n=1 Tax=unclassified Streptomyces TaxID=2593676 RepID=UPI002DD9153D|nr:glycosyltransferase [Streptomyces sp. NBC_01750]WSB01483.1 glycosyltransferase [Streptomyces sp. NBC_01794]WSD34188.1 glycosyltransferase [Streptomyces sp. NBC_01750]
MTGCRDARAVPDAGDTAADTKLSRVCLMIGQLGLGGAEKQIVMLARGLADRGIETSLLLLSERGPRMAELSGSGVNVIGLGCRGIARPWVDLRGAVEGTVADVKAYARLVAHLRRTRPQVLHAYLFHCYIAAAPAARIARVPVCVAGRRSLGTFKEGRRGMLAVERVATGMTDFVVANAHAVAEDARRQEGLSQDRIGVIHNGMEARDFRTVAPADLTSDLPVVLCVANLRKYKGHQYLLDAVGRLRQRGQLCTLVLIGEGPERIPLQQQADRLGIDVRFLSHRTDVPAFLARADVVVLPSLEEGLSNAVMEAMAVGRPVVATAVGGTPELLRDRGVLVPPADTEALAQGLHWMLTDGAAATRLGNAARQWALEHLSADTMVERHISLYRKLLERRSAR